MERKTYVTGFPRVGKNRELKWALEKYWRGALTPNELEETARKLRREHWDQQKKENISLISCNDFSYYDIMLDTAVLFGALPEWAKEVETPLDRYFQLARGNKSHEALEMTKWFNTNYHYIVPKLSEKQSFQLNPEKILTELREALELGITPKVNLIGPLTFLSLSSVEGQADLLDLLDKILPLYADLLNLLVDEKEDLIIQMEEPVFAGDPSEEQLLGLQRAYNYLTSIDLDLRLVVTTYFDHSCEALEILAPIPLWGLGLDFVNGQKNLEYLDLIGSKQLFAGVVDGRNIWRNDMDSSLALLEQIAQSVPRDRVWIGTSCSLLHVPYSLEEETLAIKDWLAFAEDKLQEVSQLSFLFHGPDELKEHNPALELSRRVMEEKRQHPELFVQSLRHEVEALRGKSRSSCYEERNPLQREKLGLPIYPSTTIGSFPQTAELRRVRKQYRQGDLSKSEYDQQMRDYIDHVIAFQEEIGLDVLVHGEPERNDMVEYFGQQLKGFCFSEKGWVQSYGSRCVKPPIIYGDVQRPLPMTVDWISYAQSRTQRPVKAMLTGPVTILNWSFVRNDLPKDQVCHQIALAISDEIVDLQERGIQVIQVDEAAFKEGYPLRADRVKYYETWAVDSFRLAVHGAKPETQIHTHMCYSQFDNIMDSIEAMDADVITIETSRSGNRLLKVFQDRGYGNEIGPGVYDIHSPRVPAVEDFAEQIESRLKVIDSDKLWVNPDCGLKTRSWDEVKPALQNMQRALMLLRARAGQQ